MKKKSITRPAFAEAMEITSQLIDRKETQFGSKSPELVSLFLNLVETAFVTTLADDLTGNMKTAHQILVTEKGAALRKTFLASYIFHDPARTEERLDRVKKSISSQDKVFFNTGDQEFKDSVFSALDLASCLEAGGKPWTSELLIRSILENCRERLHPADPLIVRALNSLALSLKEEPFTEAEELLGEALKMCEANPDTMAAHGPAVLINLHALFMDSDEHETAQDYLMRAYKAAAGQTAKRDDGYLLEVLVNLVRFYHAQSMNDEVEKVLEDIKRLTVQILKSDPWFSVTYVSPGTEVWDSDIFIEFISNLDTVVREGDQNRCFGILRLYFDLLRSKPLRRTLGQEDKIPDFLLPD